MEENQRDLIHLISQFNILVTDEIMGLDLNDPIRQKLVTLRYHLFKHQEILTINKIEENTQLFTRLTGSLNESNQLLNEFDDRLISAGEKLDKLKKFIEILNKLIKFFS